MREIKIAICGPGRAGKDTAAEYLAELLRLKYTAGTSLWAAGLVYEYFQKHAPGKYVGKRDCWHDRHNHRTLWAQVIGDYNRDDPVALYRDCLAEQNFLTGIRWRHEQQACKAAKLCDLWIYVDRPGCDDDTNQIKPEDCDFVICNYGTLEQFEEKLRNLANVLRAIHVCDP